MGFVVYRGAVLFPVVFRIAARGGTSLAQRSPLKDASLTRRFLSIKPDQVPIGLLHPTRLKDFITKFNLEQILPSSSYFVAFGDGGVRVETLCTPYDNALEVVRLPQAVPGLNLEVIGKKTLYLRPFYPDLTALALMPMKKVVLIGNPGVSKSHFQHVILCSLLAKEEEIATSTTLMGIRKQLKDINVVVRQLGVAEWHVLFIKEKLEFEGFLYVGRVGLFDGLDLSKTLYLFDSGPTDAFVQPTVVNCLSLCTLSPREDRYKGYVKQNGAMKTYMPLYKKDELVAIGLDMAKQDDFPSELADLYTESAISQRYQEFGGVLRTVLPKSVSEYQAELHRKQSALNALKLTPRKALALLEMTIPLNSEEQKTLSYSNHLALMDVPLLDSGKFLFLKCLMSPTPEVLSKLSRSLQEISLAKMRKMLMDAEATLDSYLTYRSRMLYQNVLFAHLTTTGISWQSREVVWPGSDKNTDEEQSKDEEPTIPASVSAKDADDGTTMSPWRPFTLPPFETFYCSNDMTWEKLPKNVLIYPANPNYPLVDFFYKDSDDVLVVLHVWFCVAASSMRKEISEAAMKRFLKELNIPAESRSSIKMRLVLVSPFSKAATCGFTIVEHTKSQRDSKEVVESKKAAVARFKATVPSYEVLMPPSDYGHEMHRRGKAAKVGDGKEKAEAKKPKAAMPNHKF